MAGPPNWPPLDLRIRGRPFFVTTPLVGFPTTGNPAAVSYRDDAPRFADEGASTNIPKKKVMKKN